MLYFMRIWMQGLIVIQGLAVDNSKEWWKKQGVLQTYSLTVNIDIKKLDGGGESFWMFGHWLTLGAKPYMLFCTFAILDISWQVYAH